MAVAASQISRQIPSGQLREGKNLNKLSTKKGENQKEERKKEEKNPLWFLFATSQGTACFGHAFKTIPRIIYGVTVVPLPNYISDFFLSFLTQLPAFASRPLFYLP